MRNVTKRTAPDHSSNGVLTKEGKDDPSVAMEATQEKLRGAIKVGDALAVEALVRDMNADEAAIQLVAQDRWAKMSWNRRCRHRFGSLPT